MAALSTGHQIPVPENPLEDEIRCWSQMTEMEENMTQMKDRILQYLQQSQQAALADPRGAGSQDP